MTYTPEQKAKIEKYCGIIMRAAQDIIYFADRHPSRCEESSFNIEPSITRISHYAERVNDIEKEAERQEDGNDN